MPFACRPWPTGSPSDSCDRCPLTACGRWCDRPWRKRDAPVPNRCSNCSSTKRRFWRASRPALALTCRSGCWRWRKKSIERGSRRIDEISNTRLPGPSLVWRCPGTRSVANWMRVRLTRAPWRHRNSGHMASLTSRPARVRRMRSSRSSRNPRSVNFRSGTPTRASSSKPVRCRNS